jgi:hypothetical protein
MERTPGLLLQALAELRHAVAAVTTTTKAAAAATVTTTSSAVATTAAGVSVRTAAAIAATG